MKKKKYNQERTAQLEEAGFRVIRLWGNKINRLSLEDFKKILFGLQISLKGGRSIQ